MTEAEQIDRFIAEHGVTRCPPAASANDVVTKQEWNGFGHYRRRLTVGKNRSSQDSELGLERVPHA